MRNPGKLRVCCFHVCKDLDPFQMLPLGGGKGVMGSCKPTKISLCIPTIKYTFKASSLHSWTLTWVCLQSCHSLSLCFAARFLYSVLISQGSSFGFIIPTGINRTAAAVLASAASSAEQQCGLLDKAGAGSQEH